MPGLQKGKGLGDRFSKPTCLLRRCQSGPRPWASAPRAVGLRGREDETEGFLASHQQHNRGISSFHRVVVAADIGTCQGAKRKPLVLPF